MKIRGAILDTIGAPAPFGTSRPLRVAQLELDAPGPHEVLVALDAAGVCHSDLSVVDGNRSRPVPMLLGHEAAGRVVFTGEEVTDLAPGAQVVMTFLPRCGQCAGCATDGKAPCLRGSAANEAGQLLDGGRRLHENGDRVAHHLGVSAFATHAVVDRRSIVPVDDDIPSHVAALLGCAVLTGGGAVLNAARPTPGSSIAIVGLGGVGLAAALVALAHPDVHVIGIDPLPSKLAAATALGVHETLTPDQADQRSLRVTCTIEAAGRASVFASAYRWTAPGGTTATVGLPRADDTIPFAPLSLVAEGRTVVGSYLGSAIPARDIPIFAQMWREGRLPVEKLVSSVINLDQINEAMDHLADGSQLRQIISLTDTVPA
ncbi:alcohol dehydrogenase catalytic domain-containing protein [Arthrobacter sp. NPDC080031]|uniref:alcohol dehydrogenase catalytic domain-containing protein n=1 Tax=Arthrobacter sp. NPDC080031 TaxID=3155918 RepID=UPI00344CD63F